MFIIRFIIVKYCNIFISPIEKLLFPFIPIFAGFTQTIVSNMDIIQKIEARRETLGISQLDLCRKVDITPQYYRIMREKGCNGVAFSIILALCEEVGVKVLFYSEV